MNESFLTKILSAEIPNIPSKKGDNKKNPQKKSNDYWKRIYANAWAYCQKKSTAPILKSKKTTDLLNFLVSKK